MKIQHNYILISSILLSLLISVCSYYGLTDTHFYSTETTYWQAQSIGQDIVDLFVIVPCLLLTAIISFRKNNWTILLWAGVTVYLIYTFIIYSFNIHFNKLFIAYCLILSLSVYSLIYFLWLQWNQPLRIEIRNFLPLKLTGIFLLIITFGFYFLWLSEILPSIIKNKTPATLLASGLFTNPVHVLDLSIVLPGIFIAGILLLQKKYLGCLLTPIILSFFILMDITIATLAIVMKKRGLESDLTVSYMMAALIFISVALLVWNLKNGLQEYRQTVP